MALLITSIHLSAHQPQQVTMVTGDMVTLEMHGSGMATETVSMETTTHLDITTVGSMPTTEDTTPMMDTLLTIFPLPALSQCTTMLLMMTQLTITSPSQTVTSTTHQRVSTCRPHHSQRLTSRRPTQTTRHLSQLPLTSKKRMDSTLDTNHSTHPMDTIT